MVERRSRARGAVLAMLVLAPAAMAACSRDRERKRTEEVTVTAAELLVSNEKALDRIVDARCTREAACRQVTGERPFTSREQCKDAFRADVSNRISADVCPLGVDRVQLDECVREVERDTCGNPLRVFERYLECRASELCPRVAR